MVDNSGSMATIDPGQTQTRWEIISSAVPAFASAPENAGLYVGLDFFPEIVAPDAALVADCNPTSYETPDVPIDVVPGANNAQVAALAAAITSRLVSGNTPSTPALQGAIVSAAAWQAGHPEQDTFVVFVTDGQPNGCNCTVANAAAIAAAGVAQNPPIRTFVLGVGPQVGNLDAIATGGGTGPTATVITAGGAMALTTALDAIRSSAVACDYQLPPGLDDSLIDLEARMGSQGTPTLLARVSDASACGSGAGWFLRPPAEASAAPTGISLCPSSCDALKMTAGSTLQILAGCKIGL